MTLQPQLIIGVDPGLSGSIAFLRTRDKALHVSPMPTKKRNDTSSRRILLNADLARLVRRVAKPWLRDGNVVAIVEDVSAMVYVDARGMRRGQGAAASFEFGKSQGVVLGILSALEIKTILVKPAVWKSMLNLSSDKSLSRTRASSIFPRKAGQFARKKDDGNAEAALLAWLGYKAYYLQHSLGENWFTVGGENNG